MAPVDFAAWGLNDATAQFGMQLGQSAVAAGQDYMQKNVRPRCLHLVVFGCSHDLGICSYSLAALYLYQP